MTCIFYENSEKVERFWSEWDQFFAVKELMFLGYEPKGPKLEDSPVMTGHMAFYAALEFSWNSIGGNLPLRKDSLLRLVLPCVQAKVHMSGIKVLGIIAKLADPADIISPDLSPDL